MPRDSDYVICPNCGIFSDPSENLRRNKQESIKCAASDCGCSFKVEVMIESGKEKYFTSLLDRSAFN